MENFFSRLTLDIIGKAVFNYDFDSLTHDDPVIKVINGCLCPALSLMVTCCGSSKKTLHDAKRVIPSCMGPGHSSRFFGLSINGAGGVHGAARGRVPQHRAVPLLEHPAAALAGAAAAPLPRGAAGRQPDAQHAHFQVQAPGAPQSLFP